MKKSNSFPSYKDALLKPVILRAATFTQTGKFNSVQLEIIKKFNNNKNKYLDELKKKLDKNYYYFVGRLNPPHNGHITGLIQVILKALNNNGIAILLFGEGPGGGKRTLNDPLDFNLKSEFVKNKLIQQLQLLKEQGTEILQEIDIPTLFTSGRVKILPMSKPVDQIREIIREDLDDLYDLYREIIINVTRTSGTKDDDIKKLAWMEKALKLGLIKPDGSIAPINTYVIGINPVEKEDSATAMSATQVRKDALRGFITDELVFNIENPGQGYQLFFTTYGDFYGPEYTPRIYAAIVGQAAGLSPEQIQEYINSGTLPKRGGSRAKVRKTKRRKSRRRRLTKRRKSRRRIR
jgi:hypothetical protein